MKKIFQYLFTLWTCVILGGGPYALVQLYAWSGMMIRYSQENGVVQGTIDTFGGQRPCDLCESIAEAKEQDGKRPDYPVNKLSLKLELVTSMLAEQKLPQRADSAPPSLTLRAFTDPRDLLGRDLDSPPSPPPRLV